MVEPVRKQVRYRPSHFIISALQAAKLQSQHS
uniref:Uncharacterized protein n=1 Tax=Anguilla anguilla TaxID=7936 RepID=A0A0E9VE82_ANGAN